MDDTLPASTNELTVSTKKPITFFSLPIEIRIMIYQVHLPSTTSIPLCSHRRMPKPDLGVNLLRTCRQIYLEALQYAYTERLFKTSRSCKHCCQNLTLADSNFLNHLQESAIHRIERLKLAVNVDCLASYRASRSSYRATKAISPAIQLPNIATMQSLKYVCVKVVLFRFVCCVPAHAIKHALNRWCSLGFDLLMIKIFESIPEGVEVRWEAELLGEDMPERELEETTEAATQTLQRMAKHWQFMQKIDYERLKSRTRELIE
ncbi:unnamed protein product [Aureobasidium mustum]|uniref:DUF7730 domain-containing protein n=1 Tax=Aureobasidium mustum TaxID=2773714 RepID=A0A9N8JJ58_9PEZI|nr:unnamed protein product [Aureobasidium mustum]